LRERGIFRILFILSFVSVLSAQVKVVESSGLNFKCLTASFYEPKMGVMKYLDRNSLKVDIGNSLDLIEVKNKNYSISFGADFFAYVLVNNHGFLILRVEAIDGFFGGNMSVRKGNFSYRLRILHHSAHLVDEYGELDRKPFPFTGEFADLIFAFTDKFYRLYGGLSYMFRIKPSDVRKFYFQSGLELFKDLDSFVFIFAYDVKFIDEILSFNLTAGVKLGRWNSRGVLIYFVFYDGFDIYGQYFNLKRKFTGLGCSFEF